MRRREMPHLSRTNKSGGGVGRLTKNRTALFTVEQLESRLLLSSVPAAQSFPLSIGSVANTAGLSGPLDPSFGTGGYTISTETGGGAIYASALQSDGKIVVTGEVGSLSNPGGTTQIGLARYTASGVLDPTFGTDGQTTLSLNYSSNASAMAVQSDGKIIIAGGTAIGNATSATDYLLLARFNSDGSLDTTFGSGGTVVTSIGAGNSAADSIALQANGDIVVGGPGQSSATSLTAFAVSRFNPNGTLDTSFNGTGTILTNLTSASKDALEAVAIQPDGDIVAAGISVIGFDFDASLVRYTSSGALDTSFGTSGKVLSSFTDDDGFRSVAIAPDGDIVAAGDSRTLAAIAVYTSTGSLDTSFNGTGYETLAWPGGTEDESGSLRGLEVQSDGKIFVGSSPYFSNEEEFGVACLNSNGTPDLNFGDSGYVATPLTSDGDFVFSLLLQPNGDVIAAGLAQSAGPTSGFAIARYFGDPLAPTIAATQVGNGSAQRSTISSISVTFDEAVALGANPFTLDQEVLNPDGSIDTGATPTNVTSDITASLSPDGTVLTLSVTPGGPLDRTGSDDAGFFANGIYQLILNGSAITDSTGTAEFNDGAATPVAFATNEPGDGGTSQYFHVLYGDLAGAGTVSLVDYRQFLSAYESSSGSSNFNPALDYFGNGSISLQDYRAFLKDYETSYTY
jgi:uncharacterized delta-60 repeat protein